MTGFIGIFLAVAAGLIVSTRRQLLVVIGLPLLVVLGLQTWRLAAGDGVSPPSTVTAFPGLIGYYVVQLIIFGLAFCAADQIRMRHVRRVGAAATRSDERHQTNLALLVNFAMCGVTVLAFVLERPLLDPGSVVHHRANGSPPWAGVMGILLSAVVFVVLGLQTLVSRRRSSEVQSVSQVPGEPVGQAH